MKSILVTLAATVILVASANGDDAKLKSVTPDKAACHGTTIQFVSSPAEAAKQAAQEKKLVFVLHVSGYFEDPDFT